MSNVFSKTLYVQGESTASTMNKRKMIHRSFFLRIAE